MADTINSSVPAPSAADAVETVRQPDTAVAVTTPDPRLEAMARKERQFHKMRKEIEAEKQGWKAKQAEYESNYVPKSRLAEDPLAVLTEAGISYDKLTEILLNSPNSNDPTIRAIRSEIKALKDAQENNNKRQQESQEQQYQQAVKQITTEVKLLVDSNEEYETIKETNMQDAVVELIKQTFDDKGYLMDIDDAAKEVETYLMAEALKMSKLKKLQPKLKTEQSVSIPSRKNEPQLQTSLRTLTNTVSAQSPQRSSEKERVARAMAAFKGELK